LEKTGLAADRKGFIPVNEHLETSVPGIFSTGDVNGRHMLQHAAAFEVHYLREKFLKGETAAIHETPVGHAVFSHPEVAAVGLTEDELKKSGTPYVAVFEDWLASARLEAMRIDYPRVKLLVSPNDYSILGCHLVGPEASTILHQVITVMKLNNDVRELADTVFVHPALNECLLAAAVHVLRKVEEGRKRQSELTDP
jgi:dihydrolipoamide dehydrogenase